MTKIAVIGVSCLFPGATTPAEYWQNLLAKEDKSSNATAEQMGVDAGHFYQPGDKSDDRFYCLRGGFVRDFQFSPEGYDAPAEFLQGLDTLHQWLLYTSREALQDSGYLGQRDVLTRCGMIAGNLSFPTKSSHRLIAPIYQQAVDVVLQEKLNEQWRTTPLPPLASHVDGQNSPLNPLISGYPTAVVAQALALGGTNYALDAACASSLYAVELACQQLRHGEADLMLAGAVSGADPLFVHLGFSIFHAYSNSEQSRPLDQAADGLISGEGAGVFVLKRYEDAVRDGDHIYATILGTGLSNDGRGKFLLSPLPDGQMLAYERAYQQADVPFETIDYLECHATGTPLGDKTELGTIDTFFGGQDYAPHIGSAKSNFGHLLTAAGMAGMLKVILGMAEGQIPATLSLENPRTSPNGVITPAQIVSETTDWASIQHNGRKRTAVSAFGFGGCNAHMVLEEHVPETRHIPRAEAEQAIDHRALPPLAIVGMDAHFGRAKTLRDLAQTIHNGDQHFIPVPPQRWRGLDTADDILHDFGLETAPLGGYIESFDFDFLHFRIPPNPSDMPIPQQLLMLKVADNALQDSGVAEGQNVAVLIAMGTELESHQVRGRCEYNWQLEASLIASGLDLPADKRAQLETAIKDSLHHTAQINRYTSVIGNLIASRISSKWDFTGPSFTISAEENSVFKAIQVAQLLLADLNINAVLVGAVDLAGSAESVLLRQQMARINNSGRFTLSFADEVNGWSVGEGAGALVLKRVEAASRENERIYAQLESVALAREQIVAQYPAPTTAASLRCAMRSALQKAQLTPDAIGYIEAAASGLPDEDTAEIEALTEMYRGDDLRTAVGSVKANIGHAFIASGMASLIKTALCLHHRFLPGVPHWTKPADLSQWEGTPFYVPTETRPWFLEKNQTKRYAAVNSLGWDGAAGHIILGEADTAVRETPYLTHTAPTLIPVSGDSEADLLAGLETLQKATDLPAVAQANWHASKDKAPRYTVALVAQNRADLHKQIALAQKGIPEAIASGKEWKTPQGSMFTPEPLGKTGKIAFVYPGAFNSYLGLGQDLFQLFPALHETFIAQADDAPRHWGERHVFPRSLTALSDDERRERMMTLAEDSPTMLESGMSFATVMTQMFRQVLAIEPDAAFGYSLGETSMMFALGAWPLSGTSSDYLHDAPLFHSRLAGPKTAVREFWQLPENAPDDFWEIYTVKTTPEKMRAAIAAEGHGRVFLTHINAPKKVVIAGDAEACQRVLASFRAPAVKAPYGQVIHCEPMQSEYDEFRKLNDMPVNPVPGVQLYFTADDRWPDTFDRETVNHKIATNMTTPLDFPRLVERVYEDGVRIFIELGVGTSVTGWIGDNLKGREYTAVAVNRPSKDDRTNLLLALAQLLTHQVPLDLSALYGEQPETATKKAIVKTVTLGGHHIRQSLAQAITPELVQAVQVVEKVAPAPRYQPAKLEPFIIPEKLLAERRKDAEPEQPAIENISASSALNSEPVGAPVMHIPTAVGASTNKPTDKPTQTAKAVSEQPLRQETTNTPPSRKQNGMNNDDTQQFMTRIANINQNHSDFLQGRHDALQQLAEVIGQQLIGRSEVFAKGPNGEPKAVPVHEAARATFRYVSPEPAPVEDYTTPEKIIWDEADLLEFAGGKIGNVFGPEFAEVDNYPRVVRLPLPPYLLVSRVTDLKATTGEYKPSFIQTEYDIPLDAWYQNDGQTPLCVFIESGQCDLLLISYLGIDFQNKGQYVYRLLDSTLIAVDDLPLVGQTLRYDISINGFARSGNNLLFFFSYDCYVKDKLVLKMRGGCAGFFNDNDLAGGRGIVRTDEELAARAKIEKRYFEPPLVCERTSFSKEDLVDFAHGRHTKIFGEKYDQFGYNPSIGINEQLMMVDRVTKLEPHGGVYGLGIIEGEKDLLPDDWYFPCHFKDDEVLAGSLVAQGCAQLMTFMFVHMGMHTTTVDARVQQILELPQAVRCRGQITAEKAKMTYRIEVKEIGMEPEPFMIVDIDILLNDKVVVDFKDMGLRIKEKDIVAERGLTREIGPDGLPYGTSHVYEHVGGLAGLAETGQAVPSFFRPFLSESAPSVPTAVENYAPAKPTLFNIEHMEQFATGNISKCFGDDYKIFDTRHTSRIPNGDLMLIHRVIGLDATRFAFNKGSWVTTEYDVPAQPFWEKANGYPLTVPYSIYMELGLQPSGFLSAYLGSSLLMPDTPLYFRNLDGTGEMLNDMDIRGRTIENRTTLTSHTAYGGTILQSFAYEMFVDGTPIFKGTASFGYFTEKALADQVGLDRGQEILPWFKQNNVQPLEIVLDNAPDYYAETATRPWLRLPQGQLNFLDRVLLAPNGGKDGQGYLYADKKVDPTSWFFKAHFHGDPVMPGSLGVEGMIEALEALAIQQNWADGLTNPRFTQVVGHKTVWKYRGQIIGANDLMYLELHVTEVKHTAVGVQIFADGSLWKDGLRIYEVTGLALQISGE